MGVGLVPVAAAALLVLTVSDTTTAMNRAARRRLRDADRPAGRDPIGALSALGRRL